MHKKENKKTGFTLIETLVAIAVLTVAMSGALTAVQSSLQDATIAKDQTTAFWLVQEGMEFIKNKKDENALKNLGGTTTNWMAGLTAVNGDPCYFGRTCRIDSAIGADNTGGIVDCSLDAGSVCKNLQQETTTGLYGYTAGWSATRFKRSIQFLQVPGTTDEVTAVITISWTSRGTTKSFQVSESLFNR